MLIFPVSQPWYVNTIFQFEVFRLFYSPEAGSISI